MRAQMLAIRASTDVLRARIHANAMSAPSRYGGAMLLFVSTVTWILWGFWKCDCLDRQYDDAYITFRYAHNLAIGRGLVFNPGDPTDSASSFLYTILLAAFELVGFDNLPRVAVMLGVGSAAGISMLVYLACLDRTRRPLLSFGLGFITSMHGLIATWSISGMETLLYSLIVTAAAYRLFVRDAFGWLETALVFAAFLTRFEGVLLAAAWTVVGVLRFARGQHQQRQRLVRYALAAGLGFAAFLGIKYLLYGTLIPHAFALKTITALYAPNPDALWSVWRAEMPIALALAALGLLTLPRRAESFAWGLYIAASVASLVEGPFADYARYSVHMVPLVMILSAVPLSRLLHWQFLAACALFGLMAKDSYTSFRGHVDSARVGAGHARCRDEVGRYLQRSVPAGTLILSSDIGVVAYAAPSIRFIDAVGLTSKDVLNARIDGQNADKVLFDAKPRYVADTCGGECNRIEDFAVYNWLTREAYWRTPLPQQVFTTHLKHGRRLFRCASPDGLNFGVSVFDLVE